MQDLINQSIFLLKPFQGTKNCNMRQQYWQQEDAQKVSRYLLTGMPNLTFNCNISIESAVNALINGSINYIQEKLKASKEFDICCLCKQCKNVHQFCQHSVCLDDEDKFQYLFHATDSFFYQASIEFSECSCKFMKFYCFG